MLLQENCTKMSCLLHYVYGEADMYILSITVIGQQVKYDHWLRNIASSLLLNIQVPHLANTILNLLV